MLVYVLTFVLIAGSGARTNVEVPNLRSEDHCRAVVLERLSQLPRGTRLVQPTCVQRGYST
jgi:hypothetical protein